LLLWEYRTTKGVLAGREAIREGKGVMPIFRIMMVESVP